MDNEPQKKFTEPDKYDEIQVVEFGTDCASAGIRGKRHKEENFPYQDRFSVTLLDFPLNQRQYSGSLYLMTDGFGVNGGEVAELVQRSVPEGLKLQLPQSQPTATKIGRAH